MPPLPNSAAARDVAYYIHPQTSVRRHEQDGPVIVSRGEGAYIEEMDINARSRRLGRRTLVGLQRFADHPLLGEVKGVGMIAGVELVRDKRARATHGPAGNAGKVADRIGRDNGLVLRVIGDRPALAPPPIVSEAKIDDMVARVGRTLDATHRELAG